MLLRKLFGFKTKAKPTPEEENVKEKEVEKVKEKDVENLKDKNDRADVTQEAEEPPKRTNANVVYPFYNVKATSFPPPLSIDASVYTEPQQEKQVPEESKEDEKEKQTEIAEKTKNGEKAADSFTKVPCDSETCKKEKCSPQTCDTSFKGSLKHVSEDKITPSRLTTIINSSIKEAMEIIVKQCRMDERKNVVDKKPQEGTIKSVCRESKKVVPVKVKRECQPRTVQEFSNRLKTSRSCRLQKKCNNYRLYPKKLYDENTMHRGKKGTVCEQGKKKKHSKPSSNVKTDNRRMTGNVNIYICSEANENAQATAKPKEPKPCTETSSDSTTEQSRISSSKLVTCIRNKRRKSKEQHSLEYLSKREDDSETSTTCTSKYIDSSSTTKLPSDSFIDICNTDDKNICVKDTVSVLTDCKCKDANISNIEVEDEKSESSIEEAEFVICDKIEKPCATIYTTKSLSHSESGGWSSKSTASSQNAEYVPCDNWSLEPNSQCISSEDESQRTCKRNLGNVYKLCKRDREITRKYSMRCNCETNKYSSKGDEKENSVPPWSTCNCIEEEEEEENVECKSQESEKLSQDGEGKITVCRRASEGSKEHAEVTPSTKYAADIAESSEVLRKETPEHARMSEQHEQVKISEERSGKQEALLKDERKVKEELESQQVPSTDEAAQLQMQMGTQRGRPMFIRGRLVRPEVLLLKNILKQPLPGTDQKEEINKLETRPKIETQASPDILKKYIMRDLRTNQNQTVPEEKEMVPQEKEEKASEEKDSGKDKDTKSFKAWLKDMILSKCLRKGTGKSGDPEPKLDEHIVEDNIVESTPTNNATDNNVEIPKTEVDRNQLPEKSTVEIKSAFRKGDKLNYPTAPLATQPKVEENVQGVAINSSPVVRQEAIEKNEAEAPSSDIVKKKSLVSSKEPSPPETTKDLESEKRTKLPNSLNTKEDVNYVICKESEFQDKRKSESHAVKTQNENQDRVMQPDVCSDAESITVCRQCSSEKLQTKEVRKSQSCKPEPHTICVNSKYAKRPSTNEYCINEESRSNYCCLPESQKSSETLNYPKSCLKKDRQCCCLCVHENNSSVSYQEKRHWLKECSCRRVVLCKGCCKPKNECSCRIPIVTCPNCYKPKNKCSCKAVQEVKSSCTYMKSMFCLYCDNPRDKCTCNCRTSTRKCTCCKLSMDLCTCRPSTRKCTCCKLSVDLCTCKDQEPICEGRPVLTEPDSDQIMYVTAWKPREEVRRYFSRNLTDRQTDPSNECCCHEKLKAHKSNDLPYQRLSVFSDVMDELQHKISESMCCTRCKKIPCCCNIKVDRDEGREERKIKYCISPKSRRKIIAVCMNKSSSKLSNNCKCDPNQTRGDKPNKIIVPLYCVCKATPCKCRKSKTNQKKPKAKCYYCKSSPCICIASRERNKLRPCRCTDSPCRTKEKDNVPCGKTANKSKNNDEKPICVR